MKQKPTGWSQRYVTRLRAHLKPGAQISLKPATALGRQAVAIGLKTRELARIHQQALVALEVTKSKKALCKRAEIFFAGANAPLAATHRAARQTKIQLRRLEKRTEALAGNNCRPPAGVSPPQLIRIGFGASGKHHHKCLAESLQLQKLLRQLTHQALNAQEDDRTRLSHELQDEIAQTLLGINVRLLALKQHDGHNSKSLKNEIASAQRLVLKSAKSVRQFARKLAPHHPLRSAPSRSPLP